MTISLEPNNRLVWNKRHMKEKNVPFYINVSSTGHHFLELMVNLHLNIISNEYTEFESFRTKKKKKKKKKKQTQKYTTSKVQRSTVKALFQRITPYYLHVTTRYSSWKYFPANPTRIPLHTYTNTPLYH